MKGGKRLSAANVRNLKEYSALPHAEKLRREKALKALGLVRRGLSLRSAAKQLETPPQSVVSIVGSALKKDRGRYVPTKGDRRLRVMVIPTRQGPKEVAFYSFATAQKISRYDEAVKALSLRGDYGPIQRLKDTKIFANGEWIELLTDIDELERLDRSHALSFESIYAGTA
jgi:hypothetical protein